METDTDSLYIAFARESIDECVRPEKKYSWNQKKHLFFSSNDQSPVIFDGKTITYQQYDKRTPGLYKPEFIGIGMICLSSKIYHAWSEILTKTSCKGVQKGRNEMTKEDFLDVLRKHVFHAMNAGIISDGQTMKTYLQKKIGMTYFYPKRKILEDGVSTTHLDL